MQELSSYRAQIGLTIGILGNATNDRAIELPGAIGSNMQWGNRAKLVIEKKMTCRELARIGLSGNWLKRERLDLSGRSSDQRLM